DVILARPGRRQQRVAPPDRPGDYLGAAVGQFARDFREKAIVADHHSELPEARFENRIFVPGRDARVDLAARQADLAILAGDLAIGANQHRHVVDERPDALEKTRDDVAIVFLRELAEEFG